MRRGYSKNKFGCPHCGGMTSFFASQCPHCREAIPWSARLNVSSDTIRLGLIAGSVAAGMVMGWIGFHIPKPNVETGISLVALIWYVQQTTKPRTSNVVSPNCESTT